MALYRYGAKLSPAEHIPVRRSDPIVDGDTYYLDIDFGLQNWKLGEDTRLRAIDTAEIFGVAHTSEEYHMGEKERDFVVDWFDTANNFDPSSQDGQVEPATSLPIVIQSYEYGSFSRLLIRIWRQIDGHELGPDLLDEFGDSVEYTG